VYVEDNITLTLGDGQKTNQNESVLVRSPDMIPHISNREIDRVVLVLASCHGNSRFISSEYNGDRESL